MIHLIHLQSGSNAPLVRCFFVRAVAVTEFGGANATAI